MTREIKSASDIATANIIAPQQPNDFKDRLVKLIPAEIVTTYITIQGLIPSNDTNQRLFLAIAFVTLLLLTPFYLSKIGQVHKPAQIIFTTIAFVVWVMASGGFKILFPDCELFATNVLGSLILFLYTLIIPFIYKG